MKNTELIKGEWYFTAGNVYIKFDYAKDDQIWVTEYIRSSGSYYKDNAFTCEQVIRKATAEDYQNHPKMGIFSGEINNYEIF